MKKLLFILFLSAYLFPAGEFVELLKLPVVFQHFQEHQKLNPEIGFAQFLAIHYLNDDPQAKDYKRDMELPFKRVSHRGISIMPLTTSGDISTIPDLILVEEKNNFILQNHHFVPSGFGADIFQPPRA
ncbi:MAG TPA: hypothetical protein VGD17_00830 [Chitinophagaceae bacterium]